MSKPLFDRLQVAPAYKIVSDTLQRAIVDRQLKSGDALPTEGDLAEQFGVNRSTVREGVRALEQFGYVKRQGKKLIVTRPSQDQIGHHLSNALMLHDVSFQELWEVKMVLEPLSAQLAAIKATDSQIARMQQNIEAMKIALEAGQDLVKLDLEFHSLVAEAAGNQALTMAREALARLFYPAYRASMFAEIAGQRLLEAHSYIFAAIKAHDPDTASDWMRKHIVDFKRGYEIAGLNLDDPMSI